MRAATMSNSQCKQKQQSQPERTHWVLSELQTSRSCTIGELTTGFSTNASTERVSRVLNSSVVRFSVDFRVVNDFYPPITLCTRGRWGHRVLCEKARVPQLSVRVYVGAVVW